MGNPYNQIETVYRYNGRDYLTQDEARSAVRKDKKAKVLASEFLEGFDGLLEMLDVDMVYR